MNFQSSALHQLGRLQRTPFAVHVAEMRGHMTHKDRTSLIQQVQPIDYSANLAAHAELLSRFFGVLFDPRDTVHIYPLLRDCEERLEQSDTESDYLRRMGKTVSRRPTSLVTRTLAELHELNRDGYDIFFCINPLNHPRRCQKAVVKARNILIEMDHADLDVQRQLLARFRPCIKTAVYSGGRSLHMIVGIDQPIWNPHRVGRIAVPKLKRGHTSARWPQYLDLAERWVTRFAVLGQSVDRKAARDYSRLSRVPGFLHVGTGNLSVLEHLDTKSCWDWRSEHDDEDLPSMDEESARIEMLEASIPDTDRDRIDGRDVLFPNGNADDIIKPRHRGGLTKPATAHAKAVDQIPSPLGQAPESGGTSGRVGRVCDSSTTIVVQRGSRRSFLDDVRDFQALSLNGLPGRGTRMKLHKIAFTAARVFGWSDDDLSSRWADVIRRNVTATDKTVEESVESILGDWRANCGYDLYLPNLTTLPALTETHVGILADRLAYLQCPDIQKSLRIITRVVLPLIQTVPHQCQTGLVNVLSRRLRDAVNCDGDRTYSAVWTWMQAVGIATCTNASFVAGHRARTYRLNIPLIIWLCGYTTQELDWSVAA